LGRQIHPSVASDGSGRFLAVWSSGEGGGNSQELKAQRYVNVSEPLLPLDAPFVSALSSNTLSVTWSALAGYSVSHYSVYADDSVTPTVTVTNNWWTMTGLAPLSTHAFRISYELSDGRKSPVSESTSGSTYGLLVYGGIPYEFMRANWGEDVFAWPKPTDDSDNDGVSNRNEFLAGTDPTDPDSVLRTSLDSTLQGNFLRWNTVPGCLYQVQHSSDMTLWSDLGGLRFAPGTTDSMLVQAGQQGFYRVLRVRGN